MNPCLNIGHSDRCHQFIVCPSNGAFVVPYILMGHCKLFSILTI